MNREQIEAFHNTRLNHLHGPGEMRGYRLVPGSVMPPAASGVRHVLTIQVPHIEPHAVAELEAAIRRTIREHVPPSRKGDVWAKVEPYTSGFNLYLYDTDAGRLETFKSRL